VHPFLPTDTAPMVMTYHHRIMVKPFRLFGITPWAAEWNTNSTAEQPYQLEEGILAKSKSTALLLTLSDRMGQEKLLIGI
jgi:hypothetical protein